jgi:hypothetical protein
MNDIRFFSPAFQKCTASDMYGLWETYFQPIDYDLSENQFPWPQRGQCQKPVPLICTLSSMKLFPEWHSSSSTLDVQVGVGDSETLPYLGANVVQD